MPITLGGGYGDAARHHLPNRGLMMTRDDVTVTHHSMDGFTLYALDHEEYLVHRRFIGYSVNEAMSVFLAEFGGPDNCPNRLGWTVDLWHECEHCR